MVIEAAGALRAYIDMGPLSRDRFFRFLWGLFLDMGMCPCKTDDFCSVHVVGIAV